MVFNLMITLKM